MMDRPCRRCLTSPALAAGPDESSTRTPAPPDDRQARPQAAFLARLNQQAIGGQPMFLGKRAKGADNLFGSKR
jgi:hypothetical protein